MDLSSIFGLNSRFGGVWGGRCRACLHCVRSHSLNGLVYQRVLAAATSRTYLKTAPPALPVVFRSFVGQGSWSHGLSYASVMVVNVECDEKIGGRLRIRGIRSMSPLLGRCGLPALRLPSTISPTTSSNSSYTSHVASHGHWRYGSALGRE